MVSSEIRRPPGVLVAIAALLMSLGTCGVVSGASAAGGGVPPGVAEAPLQATEPGFDPQKALLRVLSHDPLHRVLGAANVVVSILLLVGASALLARRSSAIWWITQATLANVLFTLVQVGHQLVTLYGNRDLMAQMLESRLREANVGEGGPEREFLLTWGWISLALVGVIRILPYVWATIRVRRRDVRSVLS